MVWDSLVTDPVVAVKIRGIRVIQRISMFSAELIEILSVFLRLFRSLVFLEKSEHKQLPHAKKYNRLFQCRRVIAALGNQNRLLPEFHVVVTE